MLATTVRHDPLLILTHRRPPSRRALVRRHLLAGLPGPRSRGLAPTAVAPTLRVPARLGASVGILRSSAEAELAHVRVLRDVRRDEDRVAGAPELAATLRPVLDELVVPALRGTHPMRTRATELQLRDREHVASHATARATAARATTRRPAVRDDPPLVAADATTRVPATADPTARAPTTVRGRVPRVAADPTTAGPTARPTTVGGGVHDVPAHTTTARPAARPTTVGGGVLDHLVPRDSAARPATARSTARPTTTRPAARPTAVRRQGRHPTPAPTAVGSADRVAAARAATNRRAPREPPDGARDRVRQNRRATRARQRETTDARDRRHHATAQVLVDVLTAREANLAAMEEPLARPALARPALAATARRASLARASLAAALGRALSAGAASAGATSASCLLGRRRSLGLLGRTSPRRLLRRCRAARLATGRLATSRGLARRLATRRGLPTRRLATRCRLACRLALPTGSRDGHATRAGRFARLGRAATTGLVASARVDLASRCEKGLRPRPLVVRSHRTTQSSDVVRHSASPRGIREQSLGDRLGQDRSVLINRIETGSASPLARNRVLLAPRFRATERSVRRALMDVAIAPSNPLKRVRLGRATARTSTQKTTVRTALRRAARVHHGHRIHARVRTQPAIRLHTGRSLVPASRILCAALVDQGHWTHVTRSTRRSREGRAPGLREGNYKS